MNETVLILLAAVGFVISFLIFFKGNKSLVVIIVASMSIMVLVVGLNGYNEIKKDASIYQPLAIQWLEAKNANNPGVASEIEGKSIAFSPVNNALQNYSIHCIYFSPDHSRAVVYVILPSSVDDLVMIFNRKNKKVEEVHLITKNKKPEPNFQNRLDPAISFY